MNQRSWSPIRESESMRIYLEDTDGIINLEPIRLEINGQVDEPPAVQTRLAGIGKAITRKAVMPFQGSVTDDYGLQELFFEFRTVVRLRRIHRQPGASKYKGSFKTWSGSATAQRLKRTTRCGAPMT